MEPTTAATDQPSPEARPPNYVLRGSLVHATQAEGDGVTRNNLQFRKGDWIVEHGENVQSVQGPDSFAQTYERF